MIPSPAINAIHIGPLTIHLYGVIIAIAITTCYILALKTAKKKNISSDTVDSTFFIVIPVSLIFARIYHVLTNWSYYAKYPLNIFAIWNGGIGILGAILGGIFTLYILCRKSGQSFPTMLDFLAPLMALGQSIGRWGNYFNQELYGQPTSLPWGLRIDPSNRLPFVKSFSTFHPVFLYESLLSFLNFSVLFYLYAKGKLQIGMTSALYLLNYGLIRLLIESVKLDPDSDSKVGPLRIPQYFAALLSITGILIIIRIRKKSRLLYNK